MSTPGVRSDLFNRPLSFVRLIEFFGNVQSVHLFKKKEITLDSNATFVMPPLEGNEEPEEDRIALMIEEKLRNSLPKVHERMYTSYDVRRVSKEGEHLITLSVGTGVFIALLAFVHSFESFVRNRKDHL